MPNAELDLPLPLPVNTSSKPFCLISAGNAGVNNGFFACHTGLVAGVFVNFSHGRSLPWRKG